MVTDNKGIRLGIVTYQDFLNSNLTLENMKHIAFENIFLGTNDGQVFDIMEKNVIYTKASDDVSVATRIMENTILMELLW